MPVLVYFLKNKRVGGWEKGGAMCPSPLTQGPVTPMDGCPTLYVVHGAKGQAVLMVKRRTCAG